VTAGRVKFCRAAVATSVDEIVDYDQTGSSRLQRGLNMSSMMSDSYRDQTEATWQAIADKHYRRHVSVNS